MNQAYAPFSVVIPLRNFHKYLDSSLQSLLQSTIAPAEVIIVDDGSNDNVGCWYASELKTSGLNSRIILVRIESVGAGAARQVGIGIASQPWIAFLDSDDQWPTNYIENRWKSTKKDCQIICGPCSYIDAHKRVIARTTCPSLEVSRWILLAKNVIVNTSVVCSRSFLISNGGYSSLHARSDYATWLRLAWKSNAKIFFDRDGPEVLITRRGGSLSSSKVGMIRYNYYAFRESGFSCALSGLFTVINIISYLFRSLSIVCRTLLRAGQYLRK